MTSSNMMPVAGRSIPRFLGETINDPDLVREIINDDEEGYETVEERIAGQSRWMTNMVTVFKRHSDGKLFQANWSRPSTENSGEHEYPDYAHEVRAVPITGFRYERV
jgi:hypothetical protein